MSTTTIRLEDDLKARVAAAAERAGVTAHAFILDAIEQCPTGSIALEFRDAEKAFDPSAVYDKK